MQTPKQLVIAARELIEQHGWVRGQYGTIATGFCMMGALYVVSGLKEKLARGLKVEVRATWDDINKIDGIVQDVCNCTMLAYNDHHAQSKDEIVTVFKIVEKRLDDVVTKHN